MFEINYAICLNCFYSGPLEEFIELFDIPMCPYCGSMDLDEYYKSEKEELDE